MSNATPIDERAVSDLRAEWEANLTTVNHRYLEMTRAQAAYQDAVERMDATSNAVRVAAERRSQAAFRQLSSPPLQHEHIQSPPLRP